MLFVVVDKIYIEISKKNYYKSQNVFDISKIKHNRNHNKNVT